MNRLSICILLLASIFVLQACKNTDSVGESVMPGSESISVLADTCSVQTSPAIAGAILSSPDSFLLGECDNKFGTVRADMLVQLTSPVGFQYPTGSEVDSVKLFLFYKTWYGDGHTPMEISVYQMDRGKTFDFSGDYYDTLSVAEYCSKSKLLGRKNILAAEPQDTAVSTYGASSSISFITIPMSKDMCQLLGNNDVFLSQEKFNELLNGLYITCTYGGATILYVSQINLTAFYHFSYQKAGTNQDTTVVSNKSFYFSSEVRGVNRIAYPRRNEQVFSSTDTRYIVAPNCEYARLSIPMKQFKDKIYSKMGKKRPYVNLAKLDLEVNNVYKGAARDKMRDDWAQPAPYMLLIRENAIERFFKNHEIPDDTCAVYSALRTGARGDSTYYYYYYDMSTLLTKELRAPVSPDSLHLVLVPIDVEFMSNDSTSSGTVIGVKHKQTISATAISSKATDFEVVYAGF